MSMYVRICLAALVCSSIHTITAAATPSATDTTTQDAVFSETHHFDASRNLILPLSDPPTVCSPSTDNTGIFIEAEHLFTTGQYQDCEWTVRHVDVPLYHQAAVCLAGPNTIKAWPPAFRLITQSPLTPARSGPHRLWIRMVRFLQLPAPLIVRIRQADEVILEQTVNDTPEQVNRLTAVAAWEYVDVELSGQPITIELEKPADTTPAAERIVDCLYLTSNTQCTPIGRRQLPCPDTLRQQAKHLHARGPLVAWQPDNPFVSVDMHDWPTAGQVTDTLHIKACRNERESALLMLTSTTDANAGYRITAGACTGTDGTQYQVPSVRVTAFGDTLRCGWQIHTLFRRPTVHLPAYHSTGLWVTVDTTGMPAGKYQAPITLQSDDTSYASTITVRLEVLPITLERDNSFLTGVWGGPVPAPETLDRWELWLEDLAAHGVNYPMVVSARDELLRLREQFHQLGFTGVNTRGSVNYKTANTEDPAFRKKLQQRLTALVDWREQMGLRADQLSVQFQDEPFIRRPEVLAGMINVHTLARKYAPSLELQINSIEFDSSLAGKLDGFIDLWIPHEGALNDTPTMDVLYASDARVAMYNHSSEQLNPDFAWQWTRRSMWNALRHNLAGYCYWCYSHYAGVPWSDRDTTSGKHGPFSSAMAYPGTAGPIPTRAWEAYREARDDADRVLMARKAIAHANKDGQTDIAHRAAALLDTAMDIACSPRRAGDFDRANDLVIQALLMCTPPEGK